MRVVDLGDLEMEEGPGRDGFWFRTAPLRAGLGAARIRASVYEARAGVPIWPYHYHYPTEEWLLVLDGAPVLRDAGGRRGLEPGDLACFPAGHVGAHTLEGPGRFVIFSDGESAGPFVSVYPDSDKVSVFPGTEPDGLNALRLIRGASVDYWHGEGSGPVPVDPVIREPEGVPSRPRVNARTVSCEPADGWRWAPVGEAIGARQLDAAVLELDPEAEFGPYRYDLGRELWLLAIAGTPTVDHQRGERTLSPDEVACLPEGPAGGRRILNRSDGTTRLLLLWTAGLPAAVCYPETGEWVLRTGGEAQEIRLHSA